MDFSFLTNDKYKRKRLWVLISGVLLALLFNHYHRQHQQQASGVWVETTKATRGVISTDIHAVGTLVAENQVTIAADTSGRVAHILFKDGSFVKKGMPLVQLDDAIPKAQLASAKANYFYSNVTYQRREKLGKMGLWPKQEIDHARADLAEKRALLQEKQATVALMQLVAPFDGMLGKSEVNVGHYVTAGQPLVTLTDIQYLRAEFSVSEKYLTALKLGQTVKITTTAHPDKVFVGKIAYISPTIDVRDRTISLYAAVPNLDRLLTSGMSVVLTQSVGMQHNTILLPARSIVATLDGQQVYKIINNKAYVAPVIIGQRGEESVEILQGITEQDVIVVAGQQKLHDAIEIQIKPA